LKLQQLQSSVLPAPHHSAATDSLFTSPSHSQLDITLVNGENSFFLTFLYGASFEIWCCFTIKAIQYLRRITLHLSINFLCRHSINPR
jgi:hypothetical protein